MRVKICGFTREADACAATELGADALGFNFYPKSKRALSCEKDLEWIARVPSPSLKIAVVVNASPVLLQTLVQSKIFHAIQFHGDESPSTCETCAIPWLKAFHCASEFAPSAFSSPYLLFDAQAKLGEYGGTGRLADWQQVAAFGKKYPERRVFLAGGLLPENVERAIEQVRPYAVDVAGGVESSSGKKDFHRMQDFIQTVHG